MNLSFLWRRVALLFLLLTVGFGGCKKDEAAPAPSAPSNESPEEATSGSTASGEEEATETAEEGSNDPTVPPIVKQSEALEYLPADTLALAVTEGVSPWAERLGRDELIAEFDEPHAEFVRALTHEFGLDVSDPAALAGAGVEPKGPMGMAFINLSLQSYAFFCSVSEPEKFVAFIEALGRKEGTPTNTFRIERREVNGATILVPTFLGREPSDPNGPHAGAGLGPLRPISTENWKFGWSIVLRGKTALLVYADNDPSRSLTTATVLATVAEEDSLSRHPVFRNAMESLAYGSIGAAYADTGKILLGLGADRVRNQGLGGRSEMRPEERILLDVLGEDMALALGVSEDGSGLGIQLLYTLSDSARLRKLFQSTEGTPAVIRATQKEPIYLTSARLNMTELMAFAREFPDVASEMPDIQQGLSLLNLDLQRDLIDGFTGEIGFALVGLFGDIYNDDVDLLKDIGGHVVIGLKDAARWERHLKVITALPDVASQVQRVGERYQVTVPVGPRGSSPHTFFFGVAGDYLALSTDATYFDRLAATEGQGYAATLSNPLARKALVEPSVAAVTWGLESLAWFLLQEGATPPRPSEGSAPDDPTYRAKRAALEKLEEEVETLQAARTEATNRAMLDFARGLGHVVGAIQMQDTGLVIRGGWYPSVANLATFVQQSVRMGLQVVELEKERPELWAKMDEASRLRRELSALRNRLLREQRHEELLDRAAPTALPPPPSGAVRTESAPTLIPTPSPAVPVGQ